MRFDPNAAKDVLLPDGWYDAEIVAAIDTESKKSGAPMIKATVKVWHAGGQELIDHYFSSASKGHLKQLEKLATVIGVNFEDGEIPAGSLKGASVRVFVKTQRDETGQYSDKNVITKYARMDDPNAVDGVQSPEGGSGEESPF